MKRADEFVIKALAAASGLGRADRYAVAGGQPLRVPPFPYSAPLAAPPAAAPATIPTGVVTAPPAATAEQVMPPPAARRVPRADRQ